MNFRSKPENVNRQAADWLARLHADNRSTQDEAAFRAWLNADPSHALAFDHSSTVWDAVGGLRDDPRSAPAPQRLSRRAVMAGGVGIILSAGLTVGWQQAQAGVYRTGVGEQRRLMLDDGTRVMLDTNTQIRFRARETMRLLSLETGRINLDIARDPRPFVIEAGDRRAVADVARLDLRRDDDQVMLTAIQGSARVEAMQAPVLLSQGHRIAMTAGHPDQLDRPELEDLTAWQSGRLAFRDQTVAEAAAEMNRYAERALVVSDAKAAAMRVSGVYSVGDPEAFARSLAVLLPIRVTTQADAVRIASMY